MRKIISCLLAILLLTSCAVTAFASTTDNSSTVHYGIINSPEWSQMTRIERVAACQLPAEELHNLVTDELVQVVLDYPFFVDARAFNTNREGFLRVLAESTALQELLNREDNVDSLISRYATTDVETVAATLSEDNDFSELWKLFLETHCRRCLFLYYRNWQHIRVSPTHSAGRYDRSARNYARWCERRNHSRKWL